MQQLNSLRADVERLGFLCDDLSVDLESYAVICKLDEATVAKLRILIQRESSLLGSVRLPGAPEPAKAPAATKARKRKRHLLAPCRCSTVVHFHGFRGGQRSET